MNLLLECSQPIPDDSWNSIFECYCLQVENCYFSRKSEFKRVFREWMDVFRCHSSTYLPPTHGDGYTERISQFIGVFGYCLYQLNKEEEKSVWIASLNSEFDRCVLQMASNLVLSTAMVSFTHFDQ